MSKREAFLESCCTENVDDFLRFIQLHRNKTEPFDVEEVLQEMNRDQRQTLWRKLSSLLLDVLQEERREEGRREEGREERREEGREEAMEVEAAADPNHVRSVVGGVTLVAAESLKVLQDGETYSSLLEIIHRLHDMLELQPVSEAPLQLQILRLCDAWWKKDLKEKETFGRSAMIIALTKSLDLKKPGTEIQRVCSLREVLLGLDYTSEDNKQMMDLLLKCFQHPAFLRNDDGKRFLVFLFSWNINLISVIHGTIKNQLEFLSMVVTAHIAEIYFRAWKKAGGDFLEKMESSCVQDLMQNAILLHRSSPVYGKVRKIVSYFHSRKGRPKVDKMLSNLYKPILWKALSAPNFEVRANATLLFTEAFPVLDMESGNKTSTDEAIQKQLDTVMVLLDDPHPTVRSNAILGVCKILAKYWELLPAAIITDFLKKLVMELAFDSSSPDVRCSVFKCLIIVLDNSLSHPILEKLLPTLKYSLHDNSEKVRIAFLDMLIKVKAVRAAKFWSVCSMDHLLARLAIASFSASKRIVDLLFKSFFPVNESDKEWCGRCITLIQMNPAAARKFYTHTHKHTAPTNIIKLMLAIRRILNSCIQTQGDLSEINDSNKENSAQAEPLLGKDRTVVSGLLEVVVILWRSVEKNLKQNEEAKKYTFAKFGNVISKYFHTFDDEQCIVPLIQMASLMPPAAVPTFSCGVLSRLRKMESGVTSANFSQLLDCMCSWGQAADVLELVTDWLSEALPQQPDKGNVKRKKVQIMEKIESKPDLALDYLEYLFTHSSTREKVLDLDQRKLTQLHTVLENWRSVLFSHLSSTADDKSPSVEVALKVFTYHGRLGAHLQQKSPDGREYLLSLENVAAWIAEEVLPFLNKPNTDGDEEEQEEDGEKSPLLAAQITESFLTLCRDVLLVGLGDEMFKGLILHLCSLTLLSEAGYLCIPAVLLILKEIADSYSPEDKQEEEEGGKEEDATAVILGVVANIFQKIIELLSRRLRKEPEEGRQLCQSAIPGLSNFLQVAQTWDKPPLSGVFSTLFAVIIVEKRHLLQKVTLPEEVITPESVEDMPPLSSALLSVILKLPSLTRSFLAEVSSSFESEAVFSSLSELAAVLHILSIIRHTGQCKASLKMAASSVQQQLHSHAVTSTDIQRVIYESSVKTLNEILDL